MAESRHDPAAEGGEVLLGVTGGIAAYRAVDLVRELRRRGFGVAVAMTPAARSFVGEATFVALTGRPVLGGERAEPGGDRGSDAFPHLDVGRRADVLVVAPATANSIARFAGGLADDVLAATYLGFEGPVIVCPSMNVRMWQHPATQRAVAQLRSDGVTLVGPDVGGLACGDEGAGRLAGVEQIAVTVEAAMARARAKERADAVGSAGGPLDGAVVLVTAGGTREPIDDVRFIGNRSSGRMGIALASAAVELGAREVRLIVTESVDTSLLVDDLKPVATVRTADELRVAVDRHLDRVELVVMAAAVGDFTVAGCGPGKLDRGGGSVALELVPTVDVIGALGERRAAGTLSATLVGFAAETGQGGLDRARGKLERKLLDAIVYNDVGRPDIGFDALDNEVTIVDRNGEHPLALAPKREIARRVLLHVATLVGGGQRAWRGGNSRNSVLQ